jgi:hypothetical protein
MRLQQMHFSSTVQECVHCMDELHRDKHTIVTLGLTTLTSITCTSEKSRWTLSVDPSSCTVFLDQLTQTKPRCFKRTLCFLHNNRYDSVSMIERRASEKRYFNLALCVSSRLLLAPCAYTLQLRLGSSSIRLYRSVLSAAILSSICSSFKQTHRNATQLPVCHLASLLAP